MENTKEEQLKNLKRKVLEKKNKVEAMIFELREINETLLNFSFPKEKDYSDKFEELNNSILRLTGELHKIKTEEVKVLNIEEAKNDKLEIPEYPTEMRISNLDDIVMPELKVEEKVVEFPDSFKISNLDEIKQPEIKIEKTIVSIPEEFKISNLEEIVIPEQKDIKFPEKMSIDWENAPKQEEQPIIDIETPVNNLMGGIREFFGTFFDNIYSFMGSILNYIKEPDKIVVTDTLITEYYGKKTVKYRIKRKDNKIEITNES